MFLIILSQLWVQFSFVTQVHTPNNIPFILHICELNQKHIMSRHLELIFHLIFFSQIPLC